GAGDAASTRRARPRRSRAAAARRPRKHVAPRTLRARSASWMRSLRPGMRAVPVQLVVQLLHLADRDGGEELEEEQEQGAEEADGAEEQREVHPGRVV